MTIKTGKTGKKKFQGSEEANTNDKKTNKQRPTNETGKKFLSGPFFLRETK